ncbi:hypothetical protein VFPFJ_06942 [Purpureocillium lilacinum]|uniref:Myb-like DNA-binding domain-containing protein n=1 Tax=Purpureocillium lilacinum TaxID=33203 RepID=A0A179HE31_PURLI|nr:hypothetical protein VFPFJ_06942 [Purpureocillium lilacinum]OAQ88477.1 hypothetical protein VFPFJ_06942 [Purpureocillium lilacinum]
MSATTPTNKTENRADEQVRFLVCCIKHANNGKPNFDAVAQEMNIVSKAAAQKRYERLLKAHAARAASKESDDTDIAQTPQSTPVKRKNVRGTPVSAKKVKVEVVKKEEEQSPQPVRETARVRETAPEPSSPESADERNKEQKDEAVKQEVKDDSDLSGASADHGNRPKK